LEENHRTEVRPKDAVSDESAWVAQARRGDKAAFGRLVKLHQKRVLRMVLGMVGDVDAAMDIVQESFVRAYQALERFDERQPFYPWLSTIAGNLALNHIRKSRRETRLDDELHERADPDPDPLERLQLEETDRRFLAAVQELPEAYRTVFILRNFEEMSYEEIGSRLKISPGTVDSRLYRARRLLLDKLKELLE
jgi:RNA polymerase sigma-70 factor (ECF subfamily)